MPAPQNQQFIQGVGAVSADAYNTFTQWAGNVPGLRGFPTNVDGMIAMISGTATLNDGGQGFFQWVANATAADDNGVTTVQATGVDPGRWIRVTGV